MGQKCEARRLEGKVGRSLPPLVIRAFRGALPKRTSGKQTRRNRRIKVVALHGCP